MLTIAHGTLLYENGMFPKKRLKEWLQSWRSPLSIKLQICLQSLWRRMYYFITPLLLDYLLRPSTPFPLLQTLTPHFPLLSLSSLRKFLPSGVKQLVFSTTLNSLAKTSYMHIFVLHMLHNNLLPSYFFFFAFCFRGGSFMSFRGGSFVLLPILCCPSNVERRCRYNM